MADFPDKPLNREEQYLSSIAGEDNPVPACPYSRKEAYLDAINEHIKDIEQEVEDLENNPDVVDIVDTYADLQAYDTSKLTDNDIIRVLNDETHDGESTYYRYSKSTGQFTYIGTTKQYTDFVGTDGTTAGEAGLVPAPAVADAGKFLKADGTWDTAGGGVTPVQTTGTSTTDVMSQDATTKLVFPDIANDSTRLAIGNNCAARDSYAIAIGNNAAADGVDSIAIGRQAWAQRQGNIAIGGNAQGTDVVCVGGQTAGTYGTAIGKSAKVSGQRCVAIGYDTDTGIGHAGAVALGAGARPSANWVLDIGSSGLSGTTGYNDSKMRKITGVYPGENANDAATYGQISALQSQLTSILSRISALETAAGMSGAEDPNAQNEEPTPDPGSGVEPEPEPEPDPTEPEPEPEPDPQEDPIAE